MDESKWQLTVDDLGEELLWSVAKEGDAAREKLKENDPHRPPVHRFPWKASTYTGHYPRCVKLYSLDSTVSDMTDGLSERQTHTQVISLGISIGSCTFWTQQWHDSWCVWKSSTYTDHYPEYMKLLSLDSNGRLYSWFTWKASTYTDHYVMCLKLHNFWTEQWHHSLLTCETLWTPHAFPHTHTHTLLLFLCNWTEICVKTHIHTD